MKIPFRIAIQFLIMAGMYPIQLNASDTLKEKLIDELPAALIRMQQVYSRVIIEAKEEIVDSKKSVENNKSNREIQEFINSRNSAYIANVKNGDKQVRTVNCQNEEYEFKATTAINSSQFVLNDFSMYEKESISTGPAIWHGPLPYGNNLAGATFCVFNIPFSRILESSFFNWGDVTAIQKDSQSLIRATFEFKQTDDSPHLIKAWVIFDPTLGWAITEYEGKFGLNGVTTKSGKNDYQLDDDGIVVLKKKFQNFGNYISINTINQFRIIKTSDFPENTFRLSGYGLPEPNSPSRWWKYRGLQLILISIFLFAFSITIRRKSRFNSSLRRAFTLIELMSAIGIIGLLIAILLPALQAARESSRRSQCSSNLRQIGMAIHLYENAHGVFPPGRPRLYDPRFQNAGSSIKPCFPAMVDKSPHVMILPFLEQKPLYDSINQDLSIFANENISVHCIKLNVLACPSDGIAKNEQVIEPDYLSIWIGPPPAGMNRRLTSTSYLANFGSFDISNDPLRPNCQYSPNVIHQFNGVFTDYNIISLNMISDGLGNTQFFTERVIVPNEFIVRTHGSSHATDGWYITGNFGDTLSTNMYLVNSRFRVVGNGATSWMRSASSQHPGGVNLLMGDNSVRFVKETIDTWPYDPKTGNPLNAYQTKNGDWQNLPKPGIWQALSTRNGGEITGDY